MAIHFVLYIFTILAYLFVGFHIYKRYKNTSWGKYFFILSLSISIWLFLFLFFFLADTKTIALYYSRVMHSISLLFVYATLTFFINYPNKVGLDFLPKKINLFLILLFLLSFLLVLFTPFVIEGMTFYHSEGIYSEEYGLLYPLFLILYTILLPAVLFIHFFKKNKLSFINKARFRFIVYGFLTTYFLSIFFVLLLPLFGIIYFNKLASVFLLPFLFSVFYVSHRYNFLNIKFLFGKVIIFFVSIIASFGLLLLLKNFILSFGSNFTSFWGFSPDLDYSDIIWGIIIFHFSYTILLNFFLGKDKHHNFELTLSGIKKNIFFINEFSKLISFLNSELMKNFKIKYTDIILLDNKNSKKFSEVINFFKRDLNNSFFMNDFAFIEENKNKFSINLIDKQVEDKTFLIFPLYDNSGKLIGLFQIGKKPFKDYFFEDEINSLKDFSTFLIGHLNYIEVYKRIKDINFYLEKRVDEKTIKYNQLINRQNEFINMLSHELSNPMAVLVFQFDNLLASIKKGKPLDKKSLEKEIENMNLKLIDTSKLINTVFSNQKYDMNKVELFKEPILIEKELFIEINNLRNNHRNIKFEFKIPNKVGVVNIDKIQFFQVISNLLNNSIKYANKKKPKINITLYTEDKNFFVLVEDNGEGIEKENINLVFDKYKILNSSSEGFGFGLYLCQKIVTLHGGTIKADNSKKLGGAMFRIQMPK